MTFEDAIGLRDRFRGNRGAALQAETRAVIVKEAKEAGIVIEAGGPDFETVPFGETTIGIKLRVSAELQALDGQLEVVAAELAHVCPKSRADALYEAHQAWLVLRAKEADFAALLFEGGTGAPLLGLARMVALTEQRIADLRLAKAEIDKLEGR